MDVAVHDGGSASERACSYPGVRAFSTTTMGDPEATVVPDLGGAGGTWIFWKGVPRVG